MKSEKIIKEESGGRRRWYDDACGTAMALEFVGERWSLLVLRELMFGPRRFGEIKAHLTGVSANVLTQRLENLERAGMLIRRRLSPPAGAQVYELTSWGYEIEPVLQTMGRWATRSPAHDPTLPLSPASAMLSLRTMVDRDKARALAGATIGFRLGSDRFVARVTADDLAIVRGEPMGVDVTIDTDPTTLAVWIYVKRPIAAAEAEGTMRITGDRALAERFADLFALPAKIGNEGHIE
ncbi:transcriptional regulator [Sphingomonas sp. Leaf339]|uniref:winged helix-turn-helix transcriptional regulator n=1 Tax=Sphingomonas sp. Leaf339 TaxID=1736343 RepID=UPI0006F3C1CD|nr:helix-turn-helix domain-containing protein [Sphingomonas sp. Leaf339]KQU47413.1 transcriptional regulator [Sphingomonas sp. Leaf339]